MTNLSMPSCKIVTGRPLFPCAIHFNCVPCFPSSCILDAVKFLTKLLEMQYSLVTVQQGGSIEMVNSVVYLVSNYNEDMRHGNIVWPQPAVAEQL